MNANGDLTYSAYVWTKSGKFRGQDLVRYLESTGQTEILIENVDGLAESVINSAGDVVVKVRNGMKAMDGAIRVFPVEGGSVTVDSEVIGTPDDIDLWKNAAIIDLATNDRDETGFGQIAGAATIEQPDGTFVDAFFILTPVAP